MPTHQTASYKKHFIPLESDPGVFTRLLHDLGGGRNLFFEDIWSLDDPGALQPSHLAYVLLYHTGSSYEGNALGGDSMWEEIDQQSTSDVIWFKQTIHNACGFYALLHAASNGEARKFLEEGSTLDHLLKRCESASARQRAELLEESEEIQEAYEGVALQGSTTAPEDATDEVDYHYIAFVCSLTNGHVYELDGDRKGPIDRGSLPDGKSLLAHVVPLVKSYMAADDSQLGFSFMALARNEDK